MKVTIKDNNSLKTLKIVETTRDKMFRFASDGFYFNERRIELLDGYIIKDIHILELTTFVYVEKRFYNV